MILEKHIDQKAQRQALDQRILAQNVVDQKAQRQLLDQKALAQNVVDQKYVQDYLLGMQESKSWNI